MTSWATVDEETIQDCVIHISKGSETLNPVDCTDALVATSGHMGPTWLPYMSQTRTSYSYNITGLDMCSSYEFRLIAHPSDAGYYYEGDLDVDTTPDCKISNLVAYIRR